MRKWYVRKNYDLFHSAGARFCEGDAFASPCLRDSHFQTGVLEVLNCAVTLGYTVGRLYRKLRFCAKFQVKCRFWRRCLIVEVVKIIPNARKGYDFSWWKEHDERHFSWQAQEFVDLKVVKRDFTAQLCAGAWFCECDMFGSSCPWDLGLAVSQGFLEVLNHALPWGYAMQSVRLKCFFLTSLVENALLGDLDRQFS